MIRTLNMNERRVLGVLIEKSLSQPESYPMTLNAVQAACNQKSNRDPVMDMNDDAVWHTLDALRQQGLVARVLPAPGGRTDRFKHEALAHYGWGKRQQAIMAELLLRGPQTAPELKSRCARMTAFEDAAAVMTCLSSLEANDPPLAAALPRQSGQRETRFAHLLYQPNEQPETAGVKIADIAANTATVPTVEAHGDGGHEPRGRETSSERGSEELGSEIENLQAELADVHSAIAELRRRVEMLEGRG